MKAIDLNGKWMMKNTTEKDWLEARVPGTVFGDLLRLGLAPDPYYRDNENKIAPIFKEDYEYRRSFTVNADTLNHNRVQLTCEGLDTLASISLNGTHIADTNNMHRIYQFDIKKLLREGENTIEISFSSPVKFVEENAKRSSNPSKYFVKGIEFIRKAQLTFGWDMSPALPDSGIWRDIYIECFDAAILKDIHVLQDHKKETVELCINSTFDILEDKELVLEAVVTMPGGNKLSASQTVKPKTDACAVSFSIRNPALWWPNGFGGQPLYHIQVVLKDDDKVVDQKECSIGLRTISLRREPDEWGKSFEFVINGRPIFMRGSNLALEDAMLGRVTKERSEQTLKSCAEANFNCIRIHGGAFYPDDHFYETCDRYGIILFHDFMFACSFYPVDDNFIQNFTQEVYDNVKRARNHACMGIWCGNNESELMFGVVASQVPKDVELRKNNKISETDPEVLDRLKAEYRELFCDAIPNLLKSLDPQTDYIPTSPVGGELGTISITSSEYNIGDTHYYLTNDDLAPYGKIRNMDFRFFSEFGFESYPSIKTIKSFTLPEDMTPFSDVILAHQKRRSGNQWIEEYMSRDYKVPADFEKYVYASQMIAGEIVKYVTEHLRRNEGKSMGMLTWQLNDSWPGITWSGLDYFGRWKALQYYLKRTYSPVLISALDQDTAIDLWVINDSPTDISGTVSWRLRDTSSEIIKEDSLEVCAGTCKAQSVIKLDFSDFINEENRGDHYVEFEFTSGGSVLSSGAVLFVKPKDFHFKAPKITLDTREDGNKIYIKTRSEAFAKGVAVDLAEADCIFSENYFDLSAGTDKTIEVKKSSLSKELTLEQFTRQLTVNSVYDLQ